MREMKDSGIEWIGATPETWKMIPLKYLASYNDEVLSENTDDEFEFDYIEIGSVQYGRGIIYTEHMKFKNAPSRARRIVRKDDIIVSTVRTYLKAVATIPACNNSLIASTGFIVIRPHKVLPRFMNYALLSESFISLVESYSTGISYPAINSVDVVKFKIPVPCRSEQERIAAFLDAECAEIDTVLEKTRASIEEYKKLKQAVITQAVTKGIRGDRPMKDSGIEWVGDIPAEWKVASIGRFCFVTKLAGFEFTNDMMSNIQDSGDIPIVRAQNIKMGKFINNISEFIPYRISQKLERCALNRKCLIITFIGAGIGEVAIFNEPKRYHLAPNVAKIVINVGMEHFVTEEYLLYFVMSSAGQEEINKIKKATAQPSLSMGTIRSIKMVLPDSIEEQSEIVSYLDMRCASIDALIAKKQQYLIEIENYKKSLIYEYVTGKKEVV